MRRFGLVLGLAMVGGVAIGCDPVEPADVVSPKAGAEQAEVVFGLPVKDDLPVQNGIPDKLLDSFVFRLAADSPKCVDSQIYEIRSYRGRDTINLAVDNRCGYEFKLALGQPRGDVDAGGDIDFEAYYHTEDPIQIDQARLQEEGSAQLRLRLDRTQAGETAGFKENWIEVTPSNGSAWDADEWDSDWDQDGDEDGDDNTDSDIDGDGDDDDDLDQGGNDNDGGANLTRYSDVKTIIDRKCASCHSITGSQPVSSLDSYDGAVTYADSSMRRIESGNMPPSYADQLTNEEKLRLKAWYDDGLKE